MNPELSQLGLALLSTIIFGILLGAFTLAVNWYEDCCRKIDEAVFKD